MSVFDIDPDITVAATPSAEFYLSDRFFEESKEKIFARSWQVAGRTDEVRNCAPFTLLEGFLDEPVVVTAAAESGERYALSNVCTHRGAILVEEPAEMRGLKCRYHGRRFDLDGKFLSMPAFENTKCFPTERDNLTKFGLGSLGPLLFVALNPFAPLAEFLQPVTERLGWIDWSAHNFAPERSLDYFVNAHWALYCENYLEELHIPFVHPGLNQQIDFSTYTTETFRFASLQTARTSDKSAAFSFGDGDIAALYFFVFPNLMLNFYPWGLSVNIVKPLQKDLTKVTYLTFVADESKLGSGAGGDLGQVESEDQAVVESVQRGLRSRFYDRGRYSADRETGTHHFHRLLGEFFE
jgi:choline monooxygenase